MVETREAKKSELKAKVRKVRVESAWKVREKNQRVKSGTQNKRSTKSKRTFFKTNVNVRLNVNVISLMMLLVDDYLYIIFFPVNTLVTLFSKRNYDIDMG